MSSYCTLFAGISDTWEDLDALFEEFEEEDDFDDDDFDEEKATCEAGELLGFGWWDHDWMTYVTTDDVLPLEEFFAHETVRDVEGWEIKDWDAVKDQCKKQGIASLNYVVHLGEENFGLLSAGKKVRIDDQRFIQFLGYFWPDGRYLADCT